MSDDFRFGDPRGTDTSDDMGGCCGKPVGCRIESRECVRKPEKADWQALADHPDRAPPRRVLDRDVRPCQHEGGTHVCPDPDASPGPETGRGIVIFHDARACGKR